MVFSSVEWKLAMMTTVYIGVQWYTIFHTCWTVNVKNQSKYIENSSKWFDFEIMS